LAITPSAWLRDAARSMRARSSLASIRPTRDVVGSAEIVADEILEDDAHVSAQRTEIVLSQIVATPRTARTR
jgi:hypothetical protein